jgi:hypothetical protein
MSDEKENLSQGSSLNIEAILRLSEQPREFLTPPRDLTHGGSRRRSGLDGTKIRNGMVAFVNKRKDNATMNVLMDILMVVFGLGATAAILGVIVWIINLISGTG